MKELWEDQHYAETAADQLVLTAETAKSQIRETEARLTQEREWAARHPGEWSEWVRLQPLLVVPIEFGPSPVFDFPQFLDEVGKRPSARHVVQRKDKRRSYRPGN